MGGRFGLAGGELFALPWCLDVVGLVHRRAESSLSTWRDLDAWIQARGPLVLERGRLSMALVPLVWSAGGAWVDSLAAVTIATDPASEALSFLERLTTEDRCRPAQELERSFVAGEASITVAGLARLARLVSLDEHPLTFDAFPAVEPGRGASTVWLRPRAWTLPVGGPNARLAADLALHLATDSACVALLAPRRLPAFRQATPPAAAPLAEVWNLLSVARQAPPTAAWSAVIEALEEAAAATTARRRSPNAALEEAASRVRAATMRSR